MKIFIDCGAHEGTILKENLKKYDKFVAFEPNPQLANSINKIIQENPDKDIMFYPVAVWTQEDEQNFYLSKEYTTGSTLVTGKTSSAVDYQHPIKVTTIDFSQFINKLYHSENYISVKMDIEGGEYDVLEKMIKDKTIHYVNNFLIEFHVHKLKIDGIKTRHKKIIKYFNENKIPLEIHK